MRPRPLPAWPCLPSHTSLPTAGMPPRARAGSSHEAELFFRALWGIAGQRGHVVAISCYWVRRVIRARPRRRPSWLMAVTLGVAPTPGTDCPQRYCSQPATALSTRGSPHRGRPWGWTVLILSPSSGTSLL